MQNAKLKIQNAKRRFAESSLNYAGRIWYFVFLVSFYF
jgi:hypothetical protein